MRRIVQRHCPVEPVEIFGAIGEILVVDDFLQPARRHVAQRLGIGVNPRLQPLPFPQQARPVR